MNFCYYCKRPLRYEKEYILMYYDDYVDYILLCKDCYNLVKDKSGDIEANTKMVKQMRVAKEL